jgi:O-antigen ligase
MIRYSSFAAFLFFAISLIVPSGFSVGAALLVLTGIPLLRPRRLPALSGEDKALLAVFLFYFAGTVILLLLHREPLKEYDMPLRFLLAIPALLLLMAYPPAPAFFWAGLAVGGALGGFYTGWQNLIEQIPRAGGHTNPIQYGNVSFVLGVLCFAGLSWARLQRHARTWIFCLLAGGVLGLLGAMFTGSRGSWISLPVCLLLLCIGHRAAFRRRQVARSLAGLSILFGVIYAMPHSEVQQRGQMAIEEAQDYVSNGNADSSIGIRLELGRFGVSLIEQRPLLGWGKDGLVARKAEMIRQHAVAPAAAGFNHLHNEWLDATAKRGIPGLAAALALYLVPLFIFCRHLRAGVPAARPYALCGVLLIVSYFGFGLTQVFLSHVIGVMTFAFSMAIIWGMLRESLRHRGQAAGRLA